MTTTPVAETAWDGTITCRICEISKYADNFGKDAKGAHGRKARCKDCVSKLAHGETIESVRAAIAAAERAKAIRDAEELKTPAASKVLEGKKPVRTAFYVAVLTKTATVEQAQALLASEGWPDEGRAKVAATLEYLVRTGRLTHAADGTFSPASR
jgi:hypothetical protein